MMSADRIAMMSVGGLALSLAACATTAGHQSASASTTTAIDPCARNVQNAIGDTWFLCSLASTDLAHAEAGREKLGNADCDSDPDRCKAPDTALVVRLLFSPATVGREPPRASSIELTGFGGRQAHVETRELVGPATWNTEQHMSMFERPPLTAGAKMAFELSEAATKDILRLAHDLREMPEQASWTLCKDAREDQVIFMADAAGIFVQLYFGQEEYAYLRNSMYLGHAGDIAALVMGGERNADACRPDLRF